MSDDPRHAVTRFGLGARTGDAPPADPRRWLLDQLRGPDPLASAPGVSSAEGLIALRADRQMPNPPGTPSRVHDVWERERSAIITGLVTSEAPFRERLVWFWANHFTVSQKRGEVLSVAGAYVREAIRPNVTGTFADMLMAVMTHPAMLMYLDNEGSIGPNSPAALHVKPGQPRRGLNENLARECLELHTVTPAVGYTQADVTAAAAVLTGWTIDRGAAVPAFVFRPNTHEPGEKRVMGQTFPPGMEGGVALLTWLGHHPASYAHIAYKLVAHFAGDAPPPAAVATVARVLGDTHGDLGAASAALVALPACWGGTKVRTPFDYVVAGARALSLPPPEHLNLLAAMATMGQQIMGAPLPNGWSDAAEDWNDGEALLRRVDWAWTVAAKAAVEPDAMLATALGDAADAPLRHAVRAAGSRREALALLLASPPMMRR